MDGYEIGWAVGLGAGIAIGFSLGRRQKPWSELATGEKKKIITIVPGVVLLITGVVVFLIRL